MNRRVLLSILAVAVLAVVRIASAEQSVEIKRLGWLSAGTLPTVGSNPALTRSASEVAQFFDALKSYGWIEGQNLIVERRYAGGKLEDLPRLAAELVRLKVHVIHATSGTAGLAAKNATASIPIVAIVGDMIQLGLVSNLARPDANVTGQHLMSAELAGKRLQLLRELLPRSSRIAVLGCGEGQTGGRNMGMSWPAVEAANKSLGFRLLEYAPQNADAIALALKDASEKRADGLLPLDCPRFNLPENRLILLRHRLPAIFYVETFAFAGGLMSYSPDPNHFFRRSAWYTDRILRGTAPANLPVEQPTKLRLVINLKTAKELRLTIPPNVLLRADEIID
jgi:putative tryptophan/tyrosine transport system substrate-binding protein